MADESPEPTSTRAVLIYAILVLAIIAGVVILLATRPEPVSIIINPPPPTPTPLPTNTPAPMSIYITGAVAQPGTVVTLPPDSRVQDAIEAAGGALPDADLNAVNLAAPLHDGDQVHVPQQNEGDTVLATPSGGERIYINSATAEEIDVLPGIGPALAQRIITFREENGPFASMEDLDQVEGIGPELLEQLEPLISFD